MRYNLVAQNLEELRESVGPQLGKLEKGAELLIRHIGEQPVRNWFVGDRIWHNQIILVDVDW